MATNDTVQVRVQLIDEMSNELKAMRSNMESQMAAAQASAKKAQDGFSSLGKEIGGNLANSFKALATQIIAVASIAAIGNFFKNSVKLAEESALAQTRLKTALGFTSTALLEQSEALQKTTLYDDDAILGAQGLLANYVKNEAAIKSLIPAVMDFATATGQDLTSAAQMVARAIADDGAELGRYKIKMEGAAGTSNRVASIIEGLTKQFGGQAVAVADASSGIVQLQHEFEDVQKEIGTALLPVLKDFAAWMQSDGINAITAFSGAIVKLLGWTSLGLHTTEIANILGTLTGGGTLERIRVANTIKEAQTQNDINRLFDLRGEKLGEITKIQEKINYLSFIQHDKMVVNKDDEKILIDLQKQKLELQIQADMLATGMMSMVPKSGTKGIPLPTGMGGKGKPDTSFMKQMEADAEARNKMELDFFIDAEEQKNKVKKQAEEDAKDAEKNTITLQQNLLSTEISLEKDKFKAIQMERERDLILYGKTAADKAAINKRYDLIEKKTKEDQKKAAIATAFEEAKYMVQTVAVVAEATHASAEAKKRIAQVMAIVNTAEAVTKFLGTPWMIPFALATGAAQIAIIQQQKFAQGGYGRGMALVGERGPEYVNLPNGSRVYNNQESREMSRIDRPNITLHITATTTAIVDQIRDMMRSGEADGLLRDINRYGN